MHIVYNKQFLTIVYDTLFISYKTFFLGDLYHIL